MVQGRILPTLIASLAIICCLAGCEQTPNPTASASLEPMQECHSDASVPSFVEASPFCVLQRGRAQWLCGDRQIDISFITPHGLTSLGAQCVHPLGTVIRYSGEIDRSLLTLIDTVADDADSWDRVREMDCRRRQSDPDCRSRKPRAITLLISSPGGDADAAIDIANIISNRAWSVFVERDASCLSACVFLLAAARERAVLGQVGIHRVYPSGSHANDTEELTRELEAIVSRAKALMQRNGVSPSLVDDMMSVPSTQVRILSDTDLETYGLGHDNAAQVDLERVALERRCGQPFVQRLMQARAQSDRCSALYWTQHRYEEFAQCVNSANQSLGFPDPACPNDGPTFWCGPNGADPEMTCSSGRQ
jgi:ATP-dependent protease ClpP protease subunit